MTLYRNISIKDIVFDGDSILVLPKPFAPNEDSNAREGMWSFWFDQLIILDDYAVIVQADFEPEMISEFRCSYDHMNYDGDLEERRFFKFNEYLTSNIIRIPFSQAVRTSLTDFVLESDPDESDECELCLTSERISFVKCMCDHEGYTLDTLEKAYTIWYNDHDMDDEDVQICCHCIEKFSHIRKYDMFGDKIYNNISFMPANAGIKTYEPIDYD